MMTIHELFLNAQAKHRAGDLTGAEQKYLDILSQDPNHADSLSYLGVLFFQKGLYNQAIESLSKALKINPQAPHYHNNLGNIYQKVGQIELAIKHYKTALNARQDFAEVHNNLGNIYQEKQQYQLAINHFKIALELLPDQVMIHFNLANTYLSFKKYSEAIPHYLKTLKQQPTEIEAWHGLAHAYKHNNEIEEALKIYRHLASLTPEDSRIYYHLGYLNQQYKKNYPLANKYYQQALKINPDNKEVLLNSGLLHQHQGDIKRAIQIYKKLLAMAPSDLLRLRLATILPPVYKDQEDLNQWHQRFSSNIDQLLQESLSITNVFEGGAVTNFYLTYMGLNDVDLQKKIAQIYLRACPSLGINLVQKRPSSQKISIGFVSKHFFNHSIGNFMKGIILHLNKAQFELTIFSLVENEDETTALIKKEAHEFIKLPQELEVARQVIASRSLDILFYPDIGMEPLTYFLGLSRLAPIQCVTWGHGVTTGIPNIDYFFSSLHLESKGAQAHFSERLILMKNLLPYYFRPPPPDPLKPRNYFGLNEEDNLYVCPQSIFKFHPEFDEMLKAILKRDPEGKLILLEGTQKSWADQLKQRFSKTLKPVLEQVIWLPRLSAVDFINLIAVSDVMLDPLHMCGGNTCLDALTTGTPIVTLPLKLSKSRIPYALYHQMGVMDCVVSSKEEYIDLANKIANNPDFRLNIKHKILQNVDKIYENINAVKEFEQELLKLSGNQNLFQLESALQEGIQWHKQGQLEQAKNRYLKILDNHPHHDETIHLMGILHFQSNQFHQAVEWFEKAISLDANKPHYHNNLANALRKLNQHAKAIKHYQLTLQLNPALADAHSNIGYLYFKENQLDKAYQHFQSALQLNPNSAIYHNNLGNYWQNKGDYEKALSHQQQAISLQPLSASFQVSLALSLRYLGKTSEACHYFEKAIQLNPKETTAYLNLGLLHRDLQDYPQAQKTLLKALELKDQFQYPIYLHLSEIVFSSGQIELAKSYLEQAYKINPCDAVRVRLATFLPPIYKSKEELNTLRSQYTENIQNLLNQSLDIKDPYDEQVLTHFYLSYQGYNNKTILTLLAQLYRPLLPETIPLPTKSKTNKVRIGFISRFFFDHSVTHCFETIYTQLDPEQFEVVLLALPGVKTDETTKRLISQVHRFIYLPQNLPAIRESVALENLDILIYPEIGMDNLTYFLAFTRLAPVQCVMTGHPETTGINTIDYYISSTLFEVKQAQEHYSETLVALETRPIKYDSPVLPTHWKSRSELGLSENKRIYTCPMTLFKIHPEFDQALKTILETDPLAEIYFFQYGSTGFHLILQERFNQTLAGLTHRIKWLGWQSREDFLRILYHSEVVLDTFHFGAGNTAFLTMAVGTPLITWPSELAKGRGSLANYNELNLYDCVAQTQSEYPELACKIAMNPELNQEIKAKIKANMPRLFDQPQGIKELADFFIQASKKTPSAP